MSCALAFLLIRTNKQTCFLINPYDKLSWVKVQISKSPREFYLHFGHTVLWRRILGLRILVT